MADISLRDYLSKLDTLLGRSASSEVVHHCRHILQYFPKNAATYRFLGRALVQSSSWEEAGEVFQRVLSVYPDDYSAHVGLSDVYLHLKRPDDAIWHLERAFEQSPNNQTIIDGLREMYRKFRRVEQGKIQLTSGAVARQYTRNGLYEQAIETLQQALERSPERADLRLLLAETYHEAGYRVEAAEVALEVLKVLPDCLVANRILTALWLSESRPSDAQRYLNRIQSVDPYLALELAQGEAVPDDAFRLEELDYRRAAEREINTQSPDWLLDLGGTGAPAPSPAAADDAAWMDSFAPSQVANDDDDLPIFDEAFSSDLPDDWMTGLSDTPAAAAPPPKPKTGLLRRFEEPASEPPPPEDEPDFAALFPAETTAEELFPVDEALPEQTDEPLPDLPDLFAEQLAQADVPPAPPRQTGALKDTDPLAWLHESGIEIVDNPEPSGADDLFGAEADNLALQDADAASPLAWLQGYGGDMINEDAAQAPTIPMDELPMPGDDDADPMAWLQGSGVEVVEDRSAPAAGAPQTEEPDPLDWLADESLLNEALDLEALIDSPDAAEPPRTATPQVAEWQDLMADEHDDSLDWFNAAKSEPEFGSSAEPASGEALPDWFAEMDDEPAAATDAPDWLSEMIPAEEPQPEAQTGPGGMLNWLSQQDAAAEPASELPADESGFEWMSEAASEDTCVADTGVEAMPDWMSQAAPTGEFVEEVAATADDPGFEWMSEAASEDSGAADTGVEAMPDWMSQAAPHAESEFELETPVASAQDDSGFEWMSETEAEEARATEPDAVPDWLSQLPPADDTEFVTETGGIGAARLADEPPADAEADELTLIEGIGPKVAQTLQNAGVTTFAQIASMSADELYNIVKSTPIVGDAQTWPKQAQFLVDGDINGFYKYQEYLVGGREPAETPTDDEPEAMTAAGDEGGFEWMSNVRDTGEIELDLEAASGDESGFEWMSEASAEETPDAEPETVPAADEGGFEWVSEISGDQEAPAAQPAAEVPDWLAQMSPADAEPEAEPDAVPVADEGGFEWVSEISGDQEAPATEPAAEVPDWLAQMSPTDAEPEAEPEDAPAADEGGFEWMTELNREDAVEDEPVAETPEWPSVAKPVVAQTAHLNDPGEDFPWEDNIEASEEPETPAEETPEWLSNIQSAQAGTVDEPAAQPIGDEYSWMEDIPAVTDEAEYAEETPAAPTPASNAPDWLNAMVPGLDVDYDAPEDEPIEESYLEDPADRAEAIAPIRNKKEFDWLLNIVEEETQQVAAIQDGGQKRRFVFSRPPAWLRQPTEMRDQPSSAPAADDDFDDVDLPPWLQ